MLVYLHQHDILLKSFEVAIDFVATGYITIVRLALNQ